jgi:hypothetical protein
VKKSDVQFTPSRYGMEIVLAKLEAAGEIMRTGEMRNGQPVYVATKHVGRVQ